MELTHRIDEYGKAGWITLMVLGFIIFWPIGLAILGYMIWSGRMGSWKKMKKAGRWYNMNSDGCGPRHKGRRSALKPTGNAAFDEYREQTLQRLNEEQKEFQDFLERLRQARDKEEFDLFMAERKHGTDRPEAPEGSAPQPAA